MIKNYIVNLSMRIKQLLKSIQMAFVAPSLKQKEAYSRFFHTLSAACFIGSVTVFFGESSVNTYTIARVMALIFWGVITFIIATLLSKGE